MPGPYTRLQLQGLVLDELQDPDAVYFATLKVRDFLNEGMGVWCERTRQRRATTTIDVSAENPIVSLASVSPKVLEVLRVALPSSETATDEQPLKLLTMEELERQDSNWRLTTGQPWAYVRWDQGFQSIRLYPIPSTAFSSWARSDGSITFDSAYGIVNAIDGLSDVEFDAAYGATTAAALKYGALRVDYVAGSTDMDDDADTPYTVSGIPPQFHDAIRDYAVARCLLMDTPLRQAERAAIPMARFEAKVAEATAAVNQDFQSKPARTTRIIR